MLSLMVSCSITGLKKSLLWTFFRDKGIEGLESAGSVQLNEKQRKKIILVAPAEMPERPAKMGRIR